MRVVYLLSSSGNLLYGGQYELNSRYQTYGQHSFIYDLIRAAARRGILVDLLIDGRDTFPLTVPRHPPVTFTTSRRRHHLHLQTQTSHWWTKSSSICSTCCRIMRAFCIVHNAALITQVR